MHAFLCFNCLLKYQEFSMISVTLTKDIQLCILGKKGVNLFDSLKGAMSRVKVYCGNELFALVWQLFFYMATNK